MERMTLDSLSEVATGLERTRTTRYGDGEKPVTTAMPGMGLFEASQLRQRPRSARARREIDAAMKELERAKDQFALNKISYAEFQRALNKARAAVEKHDALGEAKAALSEAKRGTVSVFLTILSSLLTQYDMATSAREEKRGGRSNIYRLGHLFGAMEKIQDALTKVHDSDAPDALNQLKTELGKKFDRDFPPAKKLVKQIDAFLTRGQLPHLPISRASQREDAAGGVADTTPGSHLTPAHEPFLLQALHKQKGKWANLNQLTAPYRARAKAEDWETAARELQKKGQAQIRRHGKVTQVRMGEGVFEHALAAALTETKSFPWHAPAAADDDARRAYMELLKFKSAMDGMDEIPSNLRPLYQQCMQTISKIQDAQAQSHQLRMMARNSVHFEATDDEKPGTIIWRQLGRARAMLGAKNPVLGKGGKSVYFTIGKNEKGINWIQVTCDDDDTYTMEFAKSRGTSHKVIKTVSGLHADQMAHAIRLNTGMATNL